jgi:hypothetical protein
MMHGQKDIKLYEKELEAAITNVHWKFYFTTESVGGRFQAEIIGLSS